MDAKEPNHMFPELQGLPKEFRRLAADLRVEWESLSSNARERRYELAGYEAALKKAAQMLEERLNGA